MRIGIEGFAFQKYPGGIGKYILSLVCLLIEKYPKAEFFIYSNKPVLLPNNISEKVRIIQDKTIFSRLNPTIWLKTIAGFIIAKDHLDFYLSGAGIFPRLGRRTRKVMVVHDLNYKIVPKTMGRLQYLSHYFFLKRDVLKADYLVVNSKGTSEKVMKYMGKHADTIINPPTESDRFKKMSKIDTQSVLQKYEIKFPYFLTVGTLEPRKNLLMTIDVFIRLISEEDNTKGIKLVIVGSKGWRNKKIIELCDRYKDDIIRLGYVNEDDLPAIYNGSLAFLFPSIYEGFGMPAREALYCGCQVITSDLVELRESCRNQAIFIDPKNPDKYKEALKLTLNNSEDYSFDKIERIESDITSFIDFFQI